MSFFDDILDEPFRRPAATIRVFGPDGEVLDTIEIPEIVIEHPFTESPESAPQQSRTTPRSY